MMKSFFIGFVPFLKHSFHMLRKSLFQKSLPRLRFAIILAVFIPLTISNFTIIFWGYSQVKGRIVNTVNNRLLGTTKKTARQLHTLLDPVRGAGEIISNFIKSEKDFIEDKEDIIELLLGFFRTLPQAVSFVVAREDGTRFVATRNMRFDTDAAELYEYEKYYAFRVTYQSIKKGREVEDEQEFDSEYRLMHQVRKTLDEKKEHVDVLQAKWYRDVKEKKVPILVEPESEGGKATYLTFAYPIFLKGTEKIIGGVAVHVTLRGLGHHGVKPDTIAKDHALDQAQNITIFHHEPEGLRSANLSSVFALPGRIPDDEWRSLKNLAATFDSREQKNRRVTRYHIKSLKDPRQDYLVYVTTLKGDFWKDFFLCVVFQEELIVDYLVNLRNKAILYSFLFMVLTLLFAFLLARRVAVPVESISSYLGRIRLLNLEEPPTTEPVFFEIQDVFLSLERVVKALEAFTHFIPKTLVKNLVEAGKSVSLGGERKTLTIFFVDIKGFTTISESLTPNALFEYTSEFFEEITRLIHQHEGTVDKYIGDAVMGFWGAPHDLDPPKQMHLACQATLLAKQRLEEMTMVRSKESLPPFFGRFGLHTAEVLVGNMGSSDRFQYSVLGDGVNLCSRLESLNKVYGTTILISGVVADSIGEAFVIRPVDYVIPRGKTDPLPIYELLAYIASEKTPQHTLKMMSLAKATEEAFASYKNKKWEQALKQYQEIATQYDDPLARFFVTRCEEFLKNPSPDDWSGAYSA